MEVQNSCLTSLGFYFFTSLFLPVTNSGYPPFHRDTKRGSQLLNSVISGALMGSVLTTAKIGLRTLPWGCAMGGSLGGIAGICEEFLAISNSKKPVRSTTDFKNE
eukprot:TRINITY_DN9763_c0_g1_i7.p1 TRINITY_DN9763_c0_g1~~TRINITY_DN9763_c0_g1_i7.p1  ORF type:complete len:105 (+),score=1.10 TRINITY_DN9763_c0_g1_i7:529-843(+)